MIIASKYRLLESLIRADVQDVVIPRPGVAILDTPKGYRKKRVPELTLEYFKDLAAMTANTLNIVDFWRRPSLSIATPAGYRMQLDLGQAIRSGVNCVLRNPQVAARPVSDWHYDPSAAETVAPIKRTLPDLSAIPDLTEKMRAVVASGHNVIISGGTGSGKTTFVNALTGFLPRETLLITIEDTPELRPATLDPDFVRAFDINRLATAEDYGYPQAIDTTTRSRPDRVILGEISTDNVLAFLRLINTGHAGTFTTVHADNPAAAADAIKMNLRLSGRPDTGVDELLAQHIGVVIQIVRDKATNSRIITEIRDVTREGFSDVRPMV